MISRNFILAPCLALLLAPLAARGASSHELPLDDQAPDAGAAGPSKDAANPPAPAPTPAPAPKARKVPPPPVFTATTEESAKAAPIEEIPTAAQAPRIFHHNPPESGFTGVTLTLDVFSPSPIRGGGAMARRVGEAAFRSFPFAELEDDYYTIDIPSDFVSAPGIEYYLYLGDKAGGEDQRKLAWGSPVDPVKVPVEGGVNTGKDLDRYRYGHEMKAFGESYRMPAALGTTESRVTEYEFQYVHRFYGSIYSVHYGQGLYQSHVLTYLSPTASTYEQQPGFFYSFLELDLGSADSKVGLAVKGMGGALSDATGAGGEIRLRYGDELGMNVSVGARGIQTLGSAATLNMRVRPLTWLGLGLGGEVGNMPDSKTLGFREYADFEIQVAAQLRLLLRGGAAAYNIQQTDGDFGAGLVFDF